MTQRPYKYVPILAESTVPDTNLLSLPVKAGVGAYNLGARAVAGLANKFVDNRTEEQKYADSVHSVSRTMENIGSRPDSIRLGPVTPAGTVPFVSFGGSGATTSTDFKPVPVAAPKTAAPFDPTYPALDLYHGVGSPDTGPTSHTEAPTVPVLSATGTGTAVPQFTERAPDVTGRLAALTPPPSWANTVSNNLGSTGSALGILTALGIASKAAESNDAQYNNEVAKVLAEGAQGINRVKSAQDTFKLNTDVAMDMPYKESLTKTNAALADNYAASAAKDRYALTEEGRALTRAEKLGLTDKDLMEKRAKATELATANLKDRAGIIQLAPEQYTAAHKLETDRIFGEMQRATARGAAGASAATTIAPAGTRVPKKGGGFYTSDGKGGWQ